MSDYAEEPEEPMVNGNLFGNCSYYIARKRRYCKMRTISNRKFCPEHSLFDEKLQSDELTERMPCPFDDKHTCLVRRLQEHLKKCNSREKEKPIYYQKSVNCGRNLLNEYKEKKMKGYFVKDNSNKWAPKYTYVTIAVVSNEELLHLINRIKITYNKFVPNLEVDKRSHPILQETLKDNESGQTAVKHLYQQSSLLGHMKDKNLLTSGTYFVEFGAGRGQLTYWIIQAVCDKSSCKFLLIDRSSQRHKFDCKLKYEKGVQIDRIRLDIEHLNLGKVPSIASHKGKVVGVSKHLCGAATDLALKCLVETLNDTRNQPTNNFLQGLIMAMCCHHQCTWQTYVGHRFLEDQQYSQRDFQLMCGIASWATCGRMTTHFESNNKDDPIISSGSDFEKNRYRKLNLDADSREEIGRKCKRILDYGRLSYLQQHNFDASLLLYVQPSISLENVALTAVSKK